VAGLIQLIGVTVGLGGVTGPGLNVGQLLVALGIQLIAGVVTTLGSGMTIYGVRDVEAGDSLAIDPLFQRAISRLPAAIAAGLLMGIAVGIGLVLFVLPGIYLAVRFAFVGQEVYLGEQGPMRSIHRSWGRTRGHTWTLLGIFLAVGVPLIVLGLIPVLGGPLRTTLVTPLLVVALTYLYLNDIDEESTTEIAR